MEDDVDTKILNDRKEIQGKEFQMREHLMQSPKRQGRLANSGMERISLIKLGESE